jgi:phytoene dehydrogenase-like protein
MAGLDAYGLNWLWPQVQYSHPLDGGAGAAVYRSVEQTAAELGVDGRRWQALFGGLTDRFDAITEDFLQPMLHLPSHPLALARFGLPSALPASMLARLWGSPEARALFGGVAAHAMRDLAMPMSAAIGVALGTAAHAFGWPVAEGGSAAISRAMIAALEAHGGKVVTGVRVDSLPDLDHPDLVLLDTSPRAAARLVGDAMPGRIRRALTKYQHGPGVYMIVYAIRGDVPWLHEASRRAGTVHVGGTYAEIASAERQVAHGLMPRRPFVLVGQQYLADPSRSHDGLNPLYVYAHVPAGFTGDATAEIERQLERFAPGFTDHIVERYTRSTVAMELHNPNYIGGDVVTGLNSARQLVFRPRVSTNPYSLGVPGVYLCSAATPPGAGAHGMCGFNAAQRAITYLHKTG